jgi:hypothetical protein
MVYNAYHAFADEYAIRSAASRRGVSAREAWLALSPTERSRYARIAADSRQREKSSKKPSGAQPKAQPGAKVSSSSGAPTMCNRLRKGACAAQNGCQWTVGKGCSVASNSIALKKYALVELPTKVRKSSPKQEKQSPVKKSTRSPIKKDVAGSRSRLPTLPFVIDSDGLPNSERASRMIDKLLWPTGHGLADETVERRIWMYEPWYSYTGLLADRLRGQKDFEEMLANHKRDDVDFQSKRCNQCLSDQDARRYVAYNNIPYFAEEARQVARRFLK